MAGYLIAEEGPLAGVTIRFENDSEWILGRDPDEVSIVLEDPMVSRRHVICRLTPEGYVLENLSSVNPATQNGKVITESVLLREGDILQIGSTFFRFTEKEPLEETPSLFDTEAEPLNFEDLDDLSSVSFGNTGMTRWLLKVISGPNAGAEFSLEKGSSYILGKDPSLSDLVFNDLSVSRQHAKISISDEDEITIEDLGSRNGMLVNGELTEDQTPLKSQDLIAIGTTSFLIIDREESHETIISAPPVAASKKEPEPAEQIKEEFLEEQPAAPVKKDWREMIIPTKHIIVAGGFCLVLIGLVASTFSLFKTENIEMHVKNEADQIKDVLEKFPDLQFTFNEATGKLFLLGHVLNNVEKQELSYTLKGLPFISSIDDNVVIDEYVWQNMNALLLSNPNWQMVSIHSPMPGRFVMKGYVETVEQAETLAEYININFPYLDRLQNNVVIENNLNLQIQGMLSEQGLSGVTYQLTGGELVLAGKVDERDRSYFKDLLGKLKGLPGVREVKNFVVYSTAETSRVDISKQYQVSGYSQGSDDHSFVVINGKVLSNGDIIDGMMITNIQSTMILLEKDGLKFRINYNLQ
ncbi:MAG: EscD/YscD/HrpQ family type III secretion system inner membrane ring protein [Chlamydiae bacterium]|nr:EscD/YscD/HrpQ family type III secretion system inner membrane ring protein [Chlamydiota bacterium]